MENDLRMTEQLIRSENDPGTMKLIKGKHSYFILVN